MTPFGPPVGRPRLGVAAPGAPDAATVWWNTGAQVFRSVAADGARLWNALFPDAAVSMPAVGGAAGAVGTAQSLVDITREGPTPQNVAGTGIGLASIWENGKRLLGFGSDSGSAAGDATSIVGPVASVAGLGISAYSLAEHPSPGAAIGLGTSAAYTVGYGASLAGASTAAAGSALAGIASAASVIGPMGAVVGAAFVVGEIFHTIARATGLTHAGFHAPPGYENVTVPGYDGAAVDPASGRLLLYHDGHYSWADGPATPEQFTAWQVQPTGKLALVPGYADVQHFRDEAITAKLQDQGTNMGAVRPDDVSVYLMQQRAPAIEQLHQADPTASPGEVWRQYTLTPEYQQEQAISNALLADARSDH